MYEMSVKSKLFLVLAMQKICA